MTGEFDSEVRRFVGKQNGGELTTKIVYGLVSALATDLEKDRAAGQRAHADSMEVISALRERLDEHCDEASVREAVAGIDRLFMLTPVTPDQVEIGRTLVRLAGDAGVQRIVKLSIIGADLEPGIALGRWHREMEHAIEDSGMAWTFLRPAGFMQNMAGLFGATVPAQGMFFLPCGDAAVCKNVLILRGERTAVCRLMMHVAFERRNVARAIIVAAAKCGRRHERIERDPEAGVARVDRAGVVPVAIHVLHDLADLVHVHRKRHDLLSLGLHRMFDIVAKRSGTARNGAGKAEGAF